MHALDKNFVTVHFVEYHDVLHSTKKSNWESSSLICVHFAFEVGVEVVRSLVDSFSGRFVVVGWCFSLLFSPILVDRSPDFVFRPCPCQLLSDSGEYFATALAVRPVQEK